MKQLVTNRSWKKHRVAFMVTTLIIILLAITGVGLIYSMKNNSSQQKNVKTESTQKGELNGDSNPGNNSSSSIDNELKRIDTEIQNNKLDNSDNISFPDTNLGL
ncbi:MAG: hypothetical protein M1324_03480 [Patescibacteria group bacterium]|nr:hypothetical protein [Patescibacteria group bacterium]